MPRSDSQPLLLDTHYWIWMELAILEQLPKPVLNAIQEASAEGRLLLSVFSVWELGMLESKGRVRLDLPREQWVQHALATPGLSLVPLTTEIALDSTRLPGEFRGDPADRILVATARRMGARLLTRDKSLIRYCRQQHIGVF